MTTPALPKTELERLLTAEFPQVFNADSGLSIVDARWRGSTVRQRFMPQLLRPGGSISGPTIFGLADFAMYVAVLASVGWQPLAVTMDLTLHFLHKPPARDLVADCTLLKLGRRLAVGQVAIRSDGDADMVAHATSTYSIPPRAS
jgi:uncharacterized protein (TIGR00369 family)